jgi:hypothetical protein
VRPEPVSGKTADVWRIRARVFSGHPGRERDRNMKKIPKVLAAVLAVGFVVALGAAPTVSAESAPAHSMLLDTGWD